MSATHDAIVIGGGANGLVAAAVLGQAGRRVLLLERDPALGGRARSAEFAPGFRAAPLALDPGWVPPAVTRLLGAAAPRRLPHDAPVTVAVEPGRFLTLWRDAARAAEAIRAHSAVDAEHWPAFTARLRRLADFLELLYQNPAPDVDAAGGELLSLLGLAGRFRGLGRDDMMEFLRALPVPVWEMLDDEFENPSLKAAVAPGGVLDHRQGPRSGGTGFVLLHHLVGAPAGAVRGRGPWHAGPDAFTLAAADTARRAGVTIRTAAAVEGIVVRDDAVAAVVLAGGEEIATRCVVSAASAARTLLHWVDPVWLDPDILHAARMIRHRGCTAFVLYALDALPDLPGLAADALQGAVSLTTGLPALERAADAAKYGTVPDRPHIEIMAPSLHGPGAAPPGKHVLVARVQYAPYRLRDGATWDAARAEALAETVTRAIAEVAPGFSARVLHRVTWTPRDLEERFALPQGAPAGGELALDQILFMRPLPGWGRHATPIRGLYLGGSSTHPGPGVQGGAGWLAARRVLGDRIA